MGAGLGLGFRPGFVAVSRLRLFRVLFRGLCRVRHLWVADPGMGFGDGAEQCPTGCDEAHGKERVAQQDVGHREPDDVAGSPEVAEHDDADTVLGDPEP